ncbi:11432_t:CDS:1, partial [Ambispora leptoticha]
DEKATLFAAALVNRTWCQVAIPLIWSTITSFNKSLIETFIKCMNDDERETILAFVKCLNDERRETIFEYFEPTYPSPLFMYTSYIKKFNWKMLDYLFTVEVYIAEHEKSIWKSILQITDKHGKENLIMQMVTQTCALIFRTASLEKFVIELQSTRYIPAFAKLPNASVVFSKLKEFRLLLGHKSHVMIDYASSYSRDLICWINSVSFDIRHLAIDLDICDNHLVNLIKMQNQLEYVSITGISGDHLSVIHALQTQANHLVGLEFENMILSNWTTLLLSNLYIFTKLKALAFSNCRLAYNASIRWSLLSQPLNCLRKLYIDYDGEDEFIEKLIETVGINLEDLTITNYCSGATYRAIEKHCKNLLSLHVNHRLSAQLSLLRAITKLQNLKHFSF